jgi:hypothetical protein
MSIRPGVNVSKKVANISAASFFIAIPCSFDIFKFFDIYVKKKLNRLSDLLRKRGDQRLISPVKHPTPSFLSVDEPGSPQ